MAKCSQCGREVSGFSFGQRKTICKWCVQHEKAQRGELPENDVQEVMTNPWERSATDSTFFTQLFVLMNVLVFVAMCVSGVSPTEPTSPELIRWGANYGPYTLGGQPWRLISCVFVHAGIIHVAMNMWCLWNLGELAEKLYGHITFLFVYLTTGLAASLASVWWRPGGVSIGASGAVFGVAGALIGSYYLGDFSFPQAVVRTYLRNVVIFGAYSLIFGTMSEGIDNAAHVGGLVCGLALGAVIAKLAPTSENWGMRAGIVILSLTTIGSAGYWLRESKSFDIHLRRGNIALADSDIDRAVSEFQKAASVQPKNVRAKLALANAYREKKDYAKVAEQLEQAVALEPTNETHAFLLGSTYLDQEQPMKARECFQHMLKGNPKSAYGHYGMGMVAAKENDQQAVINEYSRAVELNSDFTDAYYEIGRAQLALKRYDEAIASLKKAQELNGDYAETELALAEAYNAKGMTKEAQEAKTKAAHLKAGEGSDE